MLLHLYGTDTYRRRRKTEEIVAEYRRRHSDLTVASFDLGVPDGVRACSDFLANQSLFGETRLAVIYVSSEADGVEGVLGGISKSERVHAILVGDAKAKNLPTGVKSQEFSPLSGQPFSAFIEEEARMRGISISPAVVEGISRSFFDAWGVVTELDRIALGGAPEVSEKTPEFFPLVQRLKHVSLGERLSALARILAREEPARVFNILAATIQARGKERFADYDVAVKSGRLEYEEALLDFSLSP